MEIISLITKFGIYVVFAFTLAAGILAVTIRNIFHAALGLAFTLIGVAGIYFILHAEFLAAVQILLYVGAILTLIIFAFMLTSRMGDESIPTSNRWRLPVLIGILFLLLFLVRLIGKTPWHLKDSLTSINAIELGTQLMGPYVLPFELISVVLVAALIGAIVISRNDSGE